MNAATTKEQGDLKAEIGKRKAEKLSDYVCGYDFSPYGCALSRRKRLWSKPVNLAVPNLFAIVGDKEAEAEVSGLAKQVGLPALLVGAQALEDAFLRRDGADKKLAAGEVDVKGDYLSLWEIATQTFGIRCELSAELLCQILFLGLSACAGGVEGGAGGDGVKGAEGVGVHGGDSIPGSGKVEAEKNWHVVCEGRATLVNAAQVTCIFTPDKTGMYRFHDRAGEVVASFPVATTAYQLIGGRGE